MVDIESWPRASDITLTDMFFDLAMVAQAWRVTYVVSGICNRAMWATVLSALFVRRRAVSYCLRVSVVGLVIIGSRKDELAAEYRLISSQI